MAQDIDKMEFEEAISELESIAKTLEDDRPTLKESLRLYERGTLLKKHCEAILAAAQLKINQITVDKNVTINVSEVKEI